MPDLAPPSAENAAQDLLLQEIDAAGDKKSKATTDKILGAVLPTIFLLHADKAAIGGPMLHYLYAKRQAIDLWLASVWRDVDFDEGAKESLTDQSTNLKAMRVNVQSDIDILEGRLAGVSGIASGLITTTAPAAPLTGTGQPDPNAPWYRGDPRYPTSFIP